MKNSDNILGYTIANCSGVIKDEKLYLLDFQKCQLYCVCTKKNVIEKIIYLCEIKEKKPHLFFEVLNKDNFFYLIPNDTTRMACYDIKTGYIEYTTFDKRVLSKDGFCHFRAGSVVGQYLFLVPAKAKGIVCFDTLTKETKLIKLPGKEDKKEVGFVRRCITTEKEVWIAEDRGSRLLIINKATQEAEWLQLENSVKIVDICVWKKEIFCFDELGKIICVDSESREKTVIADTCVKGYNYIAKTDNYVWIFPKMAQNVLKYAPNSGIEKIEYPQDHEFKETCYKEQEIAFAGIIDQASYVYAMPRNNNILIKIDKNNEEISFHNVTYSQEMKNQIQKEFLDTLEEIGEVEEGKNGNLALLLDAILSK